MLMQKIGFIGTALAANTFISLTYVGQPSICKGWGNEIVRDPILDAAGGAADGQSSVDVTTGASSGSGSGGELIYVNQADFAVIVLAFACMFMRF